jgi:DNA-binding GntR family transcriptional regulator
MFSAFTRPDEMINAIERRDPDAAENLARVHAELFRERIMHCIGPSFAGGVSLQARG